MNHPLFLVGVPSLKVRSGIGVVTGKVGYEPVMNPS